VAVLLHWNALAINVIVGLLVSLLAEGLKSPLRAMMKATAPWLRGLGSLLLGSEKDPTRRVGPLWFLVGVIALLSLAAFGLYYGQLQPGVDPWASPTAGDLISWPLMSTWFLLMMFFSLLPRPLPKGGGKTSVASALDFSAILLFGPAVAGVLVGVSDVLSNLRRPFQRQVFNFFQMVLTVFLAASAFRLLGGSFGRALVVASPTGIIAVVAAAATYFASNTVLVSRAIATDESIKWFRHAWRRNFQSEIPSVFLFLLPAGTLLALSQIHFAYWGLFFMVLLLTLAHFAFEGRLTPPEAHLHLLRTIASEIDRSHAGTRGHSVRLAARSVRIAWELGVSPGEAQAIELAALLHNLGTLTQRRLVEKEGPLTRQEKTEMELHPQRAYDLLRNVPGLKQAAEILHAHQEQPDGSGYPRKIRDVPRGSQILLAVDAFDAMTHGRPHKEAAVSTERVYDELRKNAGHQFSRDVVDALIRLHREGRLDEELTEEPTDSPNQLPIDSSALGPFSRRPESSGPRDRLRMRNDRAPKRSGRGEEEGPRPPSAS
jgi:HD-GYP domain-containing protein (c-di-GMP phosphodiesterase class II)